MQARSTGDALAVALAIALSDTRKGKNIALDVEAGSFTLSASSAATVSNAKFNAGTVLITALTTHGGTTLATALQQTPAAGSVAVQGVTSAGAGATTDQSTYAYVAITPLFHGDQTVQYMSGDAENPTAVLLSVTAATAADLPTTIAMANQIRQVLNQHFADATAHPAADTANVVSTAIAVDLTTVEALLNACKTSFNAHLTQSGVHVYNDGTNTVGTANATDLTTSEALANALKTAINAHLASAPTGESVTLIGP